MAEVGAGTAGTVRFFALAKTEAYDDDGDPLGASPVLGVPSPLINSEVLLMVVQISLSWVLVVISCSLVSVKLALVSSS